MYSIKQFMFKLLDSSYLTANRRKLLIFANNLFKIKKIDKLANGKGICLFSM